MSLSRRTEYARRGVATVEFALVLPFILLLMLAGADVTVYLRTAMRVDETATELAVVVTQYSNLYQSDFTTLFSAAQTIAGTTPVTGLLGTTIISGIVNSNGTAAQPVGEVRQPLRWCGQRAEFAQQLHLADGGASSSQWRWRRRRRPACSARG